MSERGDPDARARIYSGNKWRDSDDGVVPVRNMVELQYVPEVNVAEVVVFDNRHRGHEGIYSHRGVESQYEGGLSELRPNSDCVPAWFRTMD